MGLTRGLTLNSGINVPNAYFRISSIFGDKEHIQFHLVAYLSREEYKDGKGVIYTESFSFEPNINDDAPNFYRQGYAYVKTIGDYKESNDILEEGQTPL